MIDHRLTSLLAGILAVACVYSASAQETGGVRISGSVYNVTTVRNSQNIARGQNATAEMSVGSIHSGVTVDGHLKMQVDADRLTNYADGPNETAVLSVGSVYEGADASGEVVVHTGSVTNVSNGPGKTSCVVIGSKGHIPECDQ